MVPSQCSLAPSLLTAHLLNCLAFLGAAPSRSQPVSCPRLVGAAVTLGLGLTLQCTHFQLFGGITQMSVCPTRERGWRVFIKLFWLQVTESNSSQRKLEEESRVRMLGPKGKVSRRRGEESRELEDGWAFRRPLSFLSTFILLTSAHACFPCFLLC